MSHSWLIPSAVMVIAFAGMWGMVYFDASGPDDLWRPVFYSVAMLIAAFISMVAWLV